MKDNKKNENLRYYDAMKEVPKEALKTISGGKLNGMTDINPMWRIKTLTENFGMCGFGWKYEITRQWNETCGQVVKTYCNINLYVKVDGEWSEPIPGTGGSSFATMESKGLYVSDENYKMALTDALSVAMKALGVGADIYWQEGANFDTKYGHPIVQEKNKVAAAEPAANAAGAVAGTADSELSEYEMLQMAKGELAQAISRDELKKVVARFPKLRTNTEFLAAGTARRKALGIA